MDEEVKSKKHVRATIPRKDTDIIAVANLATVAWEKYPDLRLVWITPIQLKESVIRFDSSFIDRNETKGSRATITREFEVLNEEINLSGGYVKNYIADTFSKKEAASYYSQFGFVKSGSRHLLPLDRDLRQHSIDQMIKAIDRHGMNDKKYGKTYWETIRSRYIDLKSAADESDSASAEYIGIKAEQKAFIIKALNCLVLAIKANYPDSWKDMLRIFGFQKEKY